MSGRPEPAPPEPSTREVLDALTGHLASALAALGAGLGSTVADGVGSAVRATVDGYAAGRRATQDRPVPPPDEPAPRPPRRYQRIPVDRTPGARPR